MSQIPDIKCDRCGDFAILVGEVTDVIGDAAPRQAFRCRGCQAIHWRPRDPGNQARATPMDRQHG